MKPTMSTHNEEQNRIFGMPRAVGIRLHQRIYLSDTGVVLVPDTVQETVDGYIVTLVDDAGVEREIYHLDKQENITRRLKIVEYGHQELPFAEIPFPL